MQKALNDQINAELYSSYLYLAMVAYFESLNLEGCAHWMRLQVQEENLHAMKIFDYVCDRGGRVVLQPVHGPPQEWTSPLVAFQDALKHEIKMTGNINKLANLAQTEKDNATNNHLQWFVDEQVEEEASVETIVQKLKLLGSKGPGLFMLDRDLAGRAPAAATEAGAGA